MSSPCGCKTTGHEPDCWMLHQTNLVEPPSEATDPRTSVWMVDFEVTSIEMHGHEWPDVLVQKWERNEIGERRFVESRIYSAAAAPGGWDDPHRLCGDVCIEEGYVQPWWKRFEDAT